MSFIIGLFQHYDGYIAKILRLNFKFKMSFKKASYVKWLIFHSYSNYLVEAPDS